MTIGKLKGALIAALTAAGLATATPASAQLMGSTIYDFAWANVSTSGGDEGPLCQNWVDSLQYAFSSGRYSRSGGPVADKASYRVNMYNLFSLGPPTYLGTVTCTFYAYGGGGQEQDLPVNSRSNGAVLPGGITYLQNKAYKTLGIGGPGGATDWRTMQMQGFDSTMSDGR